MADRGDDSADLVEFLAKAIVSNPDDVNVIVEEDGDLIELETADGDRGRVIGRQGPRGEGASRHPECDSRRRRRATRHRRLVCGKRRLRR